jgi:hypothetical protein
MISRLAKPGYYRLLKIDYSQFTLLIIPVPGEHLSVSDPPSSRSSPAWPHSKSLSCSPKIESMSMPPVLDIMKVPVLVNFWIRSLSSSMT